MGAWFPPVLGDRVVLGLALVTALAGARAARAQGRDAPAEGAAVAAARSVENVEELIHAGRYAEAEALARELLAEAERQHGTSSPEAARAIGGIVTVLLMSDREADPSLRPLAERAVAISERVAGSESLDVATNLLNLGEVLNRTSGPAAAVPVLERAVSLHRRLLGPKDPALAVALNGLARAHETAGNLAAARPLFEEMLAIDREAYGTQHPEVAIDLNNLAHLVVGMGELSTARRLLEESLAIATATVGPDHPNVATTWSNLGSLLTRLDDRAAARAAFERVIEIRRRRPETTSTATVEALRGLGLLLAWDGDVARARELLDEALIVARAAWGDTRVEVASLLTSLGSVLREAGRFAEARATLDDALAIYRGLGDVSYRAVPTLNELAILLAWTGDLAAARAYYEQAVAILRGTRGPAHPDTATVMTNLSQVLLESGQHAAALAVAREALGIVRATLGPQHPFTASCLTNLATALQETGDLEGSRKLFEEALAVRRATLPANHPLIGQALNNLALVVRSLDDPRTALLLLEDARAMQESALGEVHPDVWRGHLNLAQVLFQLGDLPAAAAHGAIAEASSREHLRLTAAGLSHREALAYAADRRTGLGILLATAAASGDRRLVAQAWDELIRSRRIVEDVLAQRASNGSTDPELRELVERQAAAARRLATVFAAAPGALDPAVRRARVAAARAELEEVERLLGRHGAAIEGDGASAGVGLAEVRGTLREGEALVAFMLAGDPARPSVRTVDPTDDDARSVYLGLVTRHGERSPILLSLGTASELDALASTWREAMARPEADAQEAGAALRRAAWDPVAALLGDATRVYVVPDGALLGVPFAALPDDRGGYLLESGPTFHFLSAERDLVGDDEPAPSRAFGLLALGGPVFDAAPWAEPTPSRVQQLIAAARAALPLALLRGSTSACSGFTGMAFDPLPDAALEARDVAKTWRAQADRAQQSRRVTELLGGQATESAFKRLASDHRYLHLATHGFFVGGACASDTTLENPLVRSGLALSGFNRRAEAPRNADDGVLTAEEVASLDLSGVEWAVLSACDTGLGDVAAGEGVIGLQRAFRIAGARTLIMSLWSVPDVETREWMKALYEARLGRGLDTPTSVRHASLAVLQHRRERGLSDQPFTWGAFVASGDPR